VNLDSFYTTLFEYCQGLASFSPGNFDPFMSMVHFCSVLHLFFIPAVCLVDIDSSRDFAIGRSYFTLDKVL
jgi:hypothetical protein